VLTGSEQLEWRDAFFNAFADQEFADLLRYRLNDRITKYTSSTKSFAYQLGDVIDAYSMRDWEARLIAMAIEARPANAALLRLARTRSAAAAPDDANLERLIRDTNSLLEISNWLDKAGELQVQVCRIEIPAIGGGTIYGTGFLVAPDMVMTNWHVVRCIIANEDNDTSYKGPRAEAGSVTCRFDYKVLPNGLKSEGAEFKLAQNWRVALSPNSQSGQEPKPDELDFAVIRLAKEAGSLPVGNVDKNTPGDKRGWIKLPDVGKQPDFKQNSSLFIIQHPDGAPLKLALDTNAIQSVNADRTRVRYSTNTEPGSSGSPGFDENWNLVALHHSGDPNFEANHVPTYNEGIPIDAIVSYIKSNNIPGLTA
jgi:V8-like Glu-specific endopeptidase